MTSQPPRKRRQYGGWSAILGAALGVGIFQFGEWLVRNGTLTAGQWGKIWPALTVLFIIVALIVWGRIRRNGSRNK